jgi:hypothetical protein
MIYLTTGVIDGEVHRAAVHSGVGWGVGAESGDEHVRDGQGEDDGLRAQQQRRRRQRAPQRKEGCRRRVRRVRAVAEEAGAVVPGARRVRLQDQRRQRREGRVAADAVAAVARLPRPPAAAAPVAPGALIPASFAPYRHRPPLFLPRWLVYCSFHTSSDRVV